MDFNTILIIRQDEIGDLCYSTPVFKLLRERFPDAKISLWCRSFAISLVKNDPHLDIIFSDKNLLEKKYDLIVDLRGGWKGLGYAFFHHPLYRLERGIVRLKNKRKGQHPHEIQTSFETVKHLLHVEKSGEPKIYFSENDKEQVKNYINKNGLKNFALFHTGARRILRKWPPENFALLAVHIKNKYGYEIVFIGDKNDADDIDEIRSKIPFKTFSSAGEINLSALAALTKQALLYIGNESGPLHIAAISDIPCIGLFGPGEPYVFYPYGKKSGVLHHILPCNPCNQITCVHPLNPCINRISVDEVYDKIIELLNDNADRKLI